VTGIVARFQEVGPFVAPLYKLKFKNLLYGIELIFNCIDARHTCKWWGVHS